MSVGLGGKGEDAIGGSGGWDRERGTLTHLWKDNPVGLTGLRSEELFCGIMEMLETRRRRRRLMRKVLTYAGLTVTILLGLGLVGYGVNVPFAHL